MAWHNAKFAQAKVVSPLGKLDIRHWLTLIGFNDIKIATERGLLVTVI